MPLSQLMEVQRRWAQSRWLNSSGPLAPSLEGNLIMPMPHEVREEFLAGSGGELGTPAQPGKMYSLRSSSALAYNFFAPWLGQDLSPLSYAMEIQLVESGLQFERQFPHGLSSTPPNLDVVMNGNAARPVGIECKYMEPYGTKKAVPGLKSKYFEGGRSRWTEVSLPRCQALAEALGNGIGFHRLDVGQLLKHLLGLAFTTRESPRLFYLWFDSGCEEADEHRREIQRFSAAIDNCIEFKAATYQDVYAAIRRGHEPLEGYFSYLSARYFPARKVQTVPGRPL